MLLGYPDIFNEVGRGKREGLLICSFIRRDKIWANNHLLGLMQSQ